MLKICKRFILLFTLLVGALALPTYADEIPEWVNAGEEWHVANPLLREGSDTCRKGHYAPNGYSYQGYTSGYSSSYYNGVTEILRITSIISGNSIIIRLSQLAAEVANWLHNHESITIKYYKYVYYNGSNYWSHIIYVDYSTGTAKQITCETFYGR